MKKDKKTADNQADTNKKHDPKQAGTDRKAGKPDIQPRPNNPAENAEKKAPK